MTRDADRGRLNLIAADRVVTGGGTAVRPLTLTIDGGRILAVTEGIVPGAEVVDGVLVPGYVDTHCHGAAGAAFTDPDPAAVARAIAHHRSHGSTTLFASTVTDSLDELVAQVGRLRLLVEQGELAGIHLEGPFLSPAHKGAHPTELLVDPVDEAVDALVEAGGGAVRMFTIAPELNHGVEACRRMARAGVVAAFGHSDADAATTRASIDAGVTVATHLFNAMRPIHHRAPGPVPVLLDDARVTVEMIADFVHLAPEIVEFVGRAGGAGRVCLVTDAMSATGSADGAYMLGRLPVQVVDSTARLATEDGTPGAIAGSTLTMDVAVENLARVGFDVREAVAMASVNPARAHGLDEVGQLAVGRWADVCVIDPQSFALRRVMRHGHWS